MEYLSNVSFNIVGEDETLVFWLMADKSPVWTEEENSAEVHIIIFVECLSRTNACLLLKMWNSVFWSSTCFTSGCALLLYFILFYFICYWRCSTKKAGKEKLVEMVFDVPGTVIDKNLNHELNTPATCKKQLPMQTEHFWRGQDFKWPYFNKSFIESTRTFGFILFNGSPTVQNKNHLLSLKQPAR